MEGPTKLRVLVVDDEPFVRSFVDRVLRDAGFETALAADGAEALAIIEKQPAFGLLLTDQLMPKMNGDELARRVRLQQPEIKVLYLTGYRDSLFEAKTTLWTGEAFLEKPVTMNELMEAVSLLLYGAIERPA